VPLRAPLGLDECKLASAVTAVSLERLADLAVGPGANVQSGQVVSIGAELGQEELARAVAAAAYRRGARFVDVRYFDPYVKRARIEHAGEETLSYVPPWYGERVLALGRERGANVALAGPVTTGALDGLDPARAGRDQLPFVKETMVVINQRLINWTVVPCPTAEWARLVYPDLGPGDALDRLWTDIVHVCRLDEPDPAEAWRRRISRLSTVAEELTEARFDAIRFEGPGTDLTVGLLPSSRWHTALDRTADGIEHLANLPTEEVYTTPDPERAEGIVRSTRPLVLVDGAVVQGLEVRFENGRAVEFAAEEGADVLRGRAAFDEGASRLGEVALVDRESRIGALRTVFFETLLDENAVSHIALGEADEALVSDEDRPRRNASAIHIDFMIGGDEVDVTGITVEGERRPLLRAGTWQIAT
jgi:aminopeptidase